MGNADIVEEIILFADNAHGNQMRKYSSERYIVHPVRVMELCKLHTGSLPVLAAAILHDVLEDTPVTAGQITDFLRKLVDEDFAKQTTQLVIELTDIYVKSAYPNLNRRQRKTKEAQRIKQISGDAQTIKYADIIDNCMDLGDLSDDFIPVYLRECLNLLSGMDKGKQELKRQAISLASDTLKACRYR